MFDGKLLEFDGSCKSFSSMQNRRMYALSDNQLCAGVSVTQEVSMQQESEQSKVVEMEERMAAKDWLLMQLQVSEDHCSSATHF